MSKLIWMDLAQPHDQTTGFTMNENSHVDLPSKIRDELKSLAGVISAPLIAKRVWDELLSEQDRKRLGGDWEMAWRFARASKRRKDAAGLPMATASMWMRARNVSWEVAVIEIACEVELLTPQRKAWLLRQIGESRSASERMVDVAIASGALVLRADSRDAFWREQPIDIDWWTAHAAQWEFFWELCRLSKRKRSLTHFELGEKMTPSAISTRKDRLVNHSAFPPGLRSFIQREKDGGYVVKLDPSEIRLFVKEEEQLREL